MAEIKTCLICVVRWKLGRGCCSPYFFTPSLLHSFTSSSHFDHTPHLKTHHFASTALRNVTSIILHSTLIHTYTHMHTKSTKQSNQNGPCFPLTPSTPPMNGDFVKLVQQYKCRRKNAAQCFFCPLSPSSFVVVPFVQTSLCPREITWMRRQDSNGYTSGMVQETTWRLDAEESQYAVVREGEEGEGEEEDAARRAQLFPRSG